ncbi:uncharacterized protein EV420DRAFT_1713694 [Desarmillaria tabescens]|uniref:Uncharacterized protein n=1 Tax=Armillaria tabescens TaxID=1929756 RepID=A0AA39JR64_ARMTA|nr:uncharacterized protein EV420DRAFT_1713694 [Desarmillaria tabescens]KAK0447400.1 hypothetical protein EV420DRAFT_1713694 [Desarmillaria tabescens]
MGVRKKPRKYIGEVQFYAGGSGYKRGWSVGGKEGRGEKGELIDQDSMKRKDVDGGGIRGLSILKQLMWKIQTEEGETPHSSAPVRLFRHDRWDEYRRAMVGRLASPKKVFGNPKRGVHHDGRFKATRFEKILKSIVASRMPASGAETDMIDDDEQASHLVPDRHAVAPQEDSLPIWKAARATTAAPTFFKRIYIGQENMEQPYIDGGAADPARFLLEEANWVLPRSARRVPRQYRNGQPWGDEDTPPRTVFPLEVVQALRGIHDGLRDRGRRGSRGRLVVDRGCISGLTVAQGLQGVSLSEWDRLDAVRSHTEQYLV